MDINDLIQNGPPHLGERARSITSGQVDGDFILYWMATAVRAHENPALDFARWLASEAKKPLLIYHGLSERYPYASDRHHTFILQGARDVQRDCRELELPHNFHLESRFDRHPHLLRLARRAAAVITEDMPVDPMRGWAAKLARVVKSPFVAVDTACIVPMQSYGQSFTRAFKFREQAAPQFARRLEQPWPRIEDFLEKSEGERLHSPLAVEFAGLDLQRAEIADLVAGCSIDHGVGPVVDTIGGSTAGYQRWGNFLQGGISGYAKKRNNALIDGVSRMSAYLHYGMVSPFRIAREAQTHGGPGAEKYLDELLIWRELAYLFCFHERNHDSFAALPNWAVQTLRAQQGDTREANYSWEQLARGKTHEELWNAAQHSLLLHGELHNNIRMTWGKAILQWVQCPEEALRMIIDLNHRYALDGRDPASYGGILWCLGQFDRPFTPPQPVIGTVRPRPLSQHARRLDVDAYTAKIRRPRYKTPGTVAVIGAGLSGLIAARTLQDHGVTTVVYEKSSRVGGRLATRESQGFQWDHGAQYFTAQSKTFQRYVRSWKAMGVVAEWGAEDGVIQGDDHSDDAGIVILDEGTVRPERSPRPRYVGVPTMRRLAEHVASDLQIDFDTRVQNLEQLADGHRLYDSESVELGEFGWVISSLPGPQAAQLLQAHTADSKLLEESKLSPCLATLVAFDEPIQAAWRGAFVHNSFLSWVARDSTKRGRPAGEMLVLHSTAEWASKHWDAPDEKIHSRMLAEFWRVTGMPACPAVTVQVKRWRYARPESAASTDALLDGCWTDIDRRLIACGDWACGSKVEGAFLSGLAAAGTVLRRLKPASVETAQQLKLF